MGASRPRLPCLLNVVDVDHCGRHRLGHAKDLHQFLVILFIIILCPDLHQSHVGI